MSKTWKIVIVVFVIFIVAAAGFVGWYFFIKKNPEGYACKNDQKCLTGLKCVNQLCSTGKAGSPCSQKANCQTKFCVQNKCSQGAIGDTCNTYKDCDSGLLCQKKSCAKRPDYSKYFDRIVISKMKPGLPPGSNNIPEETTTFDRKIDAIEVDFHGVKATTVGEYYIEFVDSVTGEIGTSTSMMGTKFEGQDTGLGTDVVQGLSIGSYDVNIYLKGELIYTSETPITIK